MRLTYIDDAGLFNPRQEPFIVVGGVIIDADEQMVPVEEHIERLVKKHIPESDRPEFVFHAFDLWHGGPYFVRDKWPLDKRLEILNDLAAIPRQFELVINAGYQERALMQYHPFPPNADTRTKELAAYQSAMARFCEKVEEFMRTVAPNEIAILIAEDRDSVRQLLKRAHAIYRNPEQIRLINPTLCFFPLERIRDTIHFAKKEESRHLQIADICTFIFKRRLMRDEYIRPFYAAIKSNLLVLPVGEDEAAESW